MKHSVQISLAHVMRGPHFHRTSHHSEKSNQKSKTKYPKVHDSCKVMAMICFLYATAKKAVCSKSQREADWLRFSFCQKHELDVCNVRLEVVKVTNQHKQIIFFFFLGEFSKVTEVSKCFMATHEVMYGITLRPFPIHTLPGSIKSASQSSTLQFASLHFYEHVTYSK